MIHVVYLCAGGFHLEGSQSERKLLVLHLLLLATLGCTARLVCYLDQSPEVIHTSAR